MSTNDFFGLIVGIHPRKQIEVKFIEDEPLELRWGSPDGHYWSNHWTDAPDDDEEGQHGR